MIEKLFNAYPNKFNLISYQPGHCGALIYRILAHNPKFYWQDSFSAIISSQNRKNSLDWPDHDIGYAENPECRIGTDKLKQRLTTVHIHENSVPIKREELYIAGKIMRWMKKAKDKIILLHTHEMSIHETYPEIKVIRICGNFPNRGDQYTNSRVTDPVSKNNVINLQLQNILSTDYKTFESEYFQLCKKLLIHPNPIPVRGYILNYLDRLNNNKNTIIPRTR